MTVAIAMYDEAANPEPSQLLATLPWWDATIPQKDDYVQLPTGEVYLVNSRIILAADGENPPTVRLFVSDVTDILF